jgi:hypothetical protein
MKMEAVIELHPDRPGGAKDYKKKVVWYLECSCGERVFELPVDERLHDLVAMHLRLHDK